MCEDVNRWCGDTNRPGHLRSAERLGGTGRKEATNAGGTILVGPPERSYYTSRSFAWGGSSWSTPLRLRLIRLVS
jgi:hypothetical protein